ncbi:2-succinyl-5-enolpyruvyl-6-hydroxy-3-cyclohexene-1-carboxylic-acid synthase [Specibacter cremeus]|uniref:2-succinyl-5-enolpyruvyl-6-hydroxy-3- cyclohexene-1-carboxylic-acid synthase n=1 Tax=Specibacter cremeus TaxID=1629051 RepID=UPI000F7ABAB8|nr:2-succinyl-5-enolpyruvyl-6-hydroxy-3-cyclohexene-1-carboxylic-acid synthase [Specibacter cremeus]
MDAARRVVDALESAGVRNVVVAPGSRSAPMVYALAEAQGDGRLDVDVRVDERVAGFTALGMALGAGAPAAVLTTSGTAVGNLLPAVMEANHAGKPLIVLSADRPEELRGTGANQTTSQLDLFGEHVRFATDIAAGTDPSGAVATALSAAQGRLPGIPAGPVQLNLAFREPLTPELDGSGWLTRPGTEAVAEPRPVVELVEPVETQASTSSTTDHLPSNEHRTVVVAGHDAGPAAEYFARLLGLPLLAEPSSNARFGPNAIGPYRLLLDHFGPVTARPIERVVVFGRPTLSRPVARLLACPELERALYVPRPVAWFEPGRRPELVLTQWEQLVGFAGRGPDGWLAAWQERAAIAERELEAVLADGTDATGVALARDLWLAGRNHPGTNLVLGSSNPVRDVDLAGRPGAGHHYARVFANRGLAGIDGTVATATGIALATGRPTRVLLGDLTLLHDAGALLTGPGERAADLQVVVLNDDGGGIFTTLEHGRLGETPVYRAAVERFFGTPHQVNLSALAVAYGWAHRAVTPGAELSAILDAPVTGRSIVEVRAKRTDLRALHARLAEALAP